MELARHWLARCIKTHKRCGSAGDSALPSRVLDLGSSTSSTITLRETRGDMGRYICLSYCWGKADFIKTTRGNFERHKKGIDFHELPRTFQDVVQVTRVLGVRYSWIDSLCIIQDDADDWKVESGRMADIYRHSYLTVAATWADSANGGCFSAP